MWALDNSVYRRCSLALRTQNVTAGEVRPNLFNLKKLYSNFDFECTIIFNYVGCRSLLNIYMLLMWWCLWITGSVPMIVAVHIGKTRCCTCVLYALKACRLQTRPIHNMIFNYYTVLNVLKINVFNEVNFFFWRCCGF